MGKQRVAEQLVIDEGLRLKPYRCSAGKLTIGVGRNLDDRGITSSEAMMLLFNDIDDFWAKLLKALPWIDKAPVLGTAIGGPLGALAGTAIKAVLDALTHAKVWSDDCLIDALHVLRGPKVAAGQLVVEIVPIPMALERGAA